MDTALAQIEKQKMELEHSRRLLDQERKQFTEAAVRMGIERATLLREKEAIEEEKRIKEMEQVLKQMPSTPL